MHVHLHVFVCCVQVRPLTGPLEGGIVVTVLGSNLGQRYEDIENGVMVAGVTCKPLRNAYLISTRYTHPRTHYH